MPVDLGWCDSYQTDYAERCCKVRFITDNKTKEITIIQSPHSVANGNSPYYQWGRKDPFPPSNGSDNSNKTWYTADGTPSDASPTTKNLSTSLDCIKNYILNPNVMHDQKEGGVYTNLWSVNNNTSIPNDAEVVKTIYDPCPLALNFLSAMLLQDLPQQVKRQRSQIKLTVVGIIQKRDGIFTQIPQRTRPFSSQRLDFVIIPVVRCKKLVKRAIGGWRFQMTG